MTYSNLPIQLVPRPEIGAGRPGVVVGLGLANPCIAENYASRTLRVFVNVESVVELAEVSNIAVVLVHADNLSVELYELLYSGAFSPAPGIIFASSEGELESVSKRFASNLLPLPRPKFRRACVASREVNSASEKYDLVADQNSSFGDVCDIYSADVGFLSMDGHSDGLHISAPGGTMLCPMSAGIKTVSRLQPHCFEQKCCTKYRHLPSLENAWSSNRLIDVERINARVVFYDSCFAFRVADNIVSPGYSLSCSLAERSNVHAVIGSWQITLGDPSVSQFIAAGLEAGEGIGWVISRFNRQEEVARHGRVLALLGDPAYRLHDAQPPPHGIQFDNKEFDEPGR